MAVKPCLFWSMQSIRHHVSRKLSLSVRSFSVLPNVSNDFICINGKKYQRDNVTNVPERILAKIGRNLHNQKYHPLNLLKFRIRDFFYHYFTNRIGNPIFVVLDNLDPVVSVEKNFDSILIPRDHVSRNLSDTYYVNSSTVLRTHTTCHEPELIGMGTNTFLTFGDVYRRDSVDSTHYPIFHQCEGVMLFSNKELFQNETPNLPELDLFQTPPDPKRLVSKQECHSVDAANTVELHLKKCLEDLAVYLFGSAIETRWVDVYFPFTHPSWELEIWYENDWMEILGCGILEQEILNRNGAQNRIGWAFGLGLERIAMKLYGIPDIRLFWSTDTGFTTQFHGLKPQDEVTYKPISKYPQCINDVSFWLPTGGYSSNDFYDIVRDVGGDVVEQVKLVDEYQKPNSEEISHCYRIVYRHMEKTFTQEEVNAIHDRISDASVRLLGVRIR